MMAADEVTKQMGIWRTQRDLIYALRNFIKFKKLDETETVQFGKAQLDWEEAVAKWAECCRNPKYSREEYLNSRNDFFNAQQNYIKAMIGILHENPVLEIGYELDGKQSGTPARSS